MNLSLQGASTVVMYVVFGIYEFIWAISIKTESREGCIIIKKRKDTGYGHSIYDSKAVIIH